MCARARVCVQYVPKGTMFLKVSFSTGLHFVAFQFPVQRGHFVEEKCHKTAVIKTSALLCLSVFYTSLGAIGADSVVDSVRPHCW